MTRKAKLAWVIGASVLGSSVALATYFDLPGSVQSFQRGDYKVYISEVNYQDVTRSDEADFIEIHNAGSKEIALTQWCIRGLDYCFDERTLLPAGGFVVVTGADAEGKFSNSGETLQLVDVADNIVDEVAYSDQAPWPRSANGRGHSLHRRHLPDEASDNESATTSVGTVESSGNVSEWVADLPSPGAEYDENDRRQPQESASVVIGEVHYHPENDNPAEEFIELVNISQQAVSLDKWCLVELNRCFTATDVLEAGASVVVAPLDTQMELSNSRGVLQLLDSDKKVRDIVYYEDNDMWPALADGHGLSLHRRNGRLAGVEPGNWDAREPTPGVTDLPSSTVGLMPTFEDVRGTVSPSAAEQIVVSATVRDGTAVQMQYRVNFEPDIVVPMQKKSPNQFSVSIPAQAPGTLVRYRLISSVADGEGSWPRVGDGMVYRGTVVQPIEKSSLPRLQWFVEDDYYSQIYNDSGLFGDNGYPTVIAFDGEVFDGAVIRVRGNQSRLNDKKKWKVVLPAGYETTLGGLLPNAVNEFALNSAVTDKSFVREILTSELQKLGGGVGQQVFPLRLEKNNQFYGLYLYQEQPDGRWREKLGFSDNTAAFKSDRQATLRANQLELPNSEMRQRYQRQTQDWLEHVDEIRELIRQVNNDNEQQVLDFAYKHLDIPQIIEAIATMRVAQHLEWEHKNHLLLFDPADEKWRLVPIDFDLNFGRQWVAGCNALCDTVSAIAYMEYMEANRLGRLFLKIPELRELLDRRTKTLADLYLADGYLEKRISEIEALIRDDAALDRKNWYTYGEKQTIQQAQKILIDNYVVPKRKLLTGPASPRLPGPQNNTISYTMTVTSSVTMTNTDTVAIDVSGIELPTLSSKVPAGTVLRPGQSAVFTTERRPHNVDSRQLQVWVPSSK